MWWIQNIPTFAQRAKQAKSSCKHQLGPVLFLCEIYHQAHTVCRYISQEALLKDGAKSLATEVRRLASRPSRAGPSPSGEPYRQRLREKALATGGASLRDVKDASGPSDGPRLWRGSLASRSDARRLVWPAKAKRKELLHSAKSTDLRSAKSTDKNTDLSSAWREPLGSALLARYPSDGMQETFLSLGLQSRLSPLLQRNLQC